MPDTVPTDGLSAIPVKMVSSLSAQYWNASTQQTSGPVLPVKNATNLATQSSGNFGSYFYAVCDGAFFYLIDEIVEESAKKFSAMVYSGTDYTLGSGVEIDVDTKGAVRDFSIQNYDWTLIEPAQLKVELWTTAGLFDTIILDREYWDDGSRKYVESVPTYKASRPAKEDYYPPWEIWMVSMDVGWRYFSDTGTWGDRVEFYISTKWQWDWPEYQIGWIHIANALFGRRKAGHPWPHCTGIFDFISVGGEFGYDAPGGNVIPYTPDGSYLKVYPLGFLP